MECFVARSVAPPARMEQWNAQLSSLFSGLVADPQEPDYFDGSLRWASAGALTTACAAAKPCRMYHPATSGPGQASSFLLKVQVRGRSLAEHCGQEAHLLPGDMILFDSDKSHRLTLLDDSEMLAFGIPKILTTEHAGLLEPLAGLRLSSDAPSVRICADYAENLWRQHLDCGPSDLSRRSENILTDLIDLIGLCTPCSVDGSHRPSRADWMRIQHYLHGRILDPDLTVTRISADLGVTPRRLQQIFAAKGTTPAKHILGERLKEARRLLSDVNSRDLSITDIAFDVGFGDLTYFGRAFRARYGCSANIFRRSVLRS